MSSGLWLLLMDSRAEFIIGKLLPIIGLKMNLKLEYLHQIFLISILPFVTIPSDGPSMVNDYLNVRFGSIASPFECFRTSIREKI